MTQTLITRAGKRIALQPIDGLRRVLAAEKAIRPDNRPLIESGRVTVNDKSGLEIVPLRAVSGSFSGI